MIGATLDRNGLRPARYLVTTGGQLILASEAAVTQTLARGVHVANVKRASLSSELLLPVTVHGLDMTGRALCQNGSVTLGTSGTVTLPTSTSNGQAQLRRP